MFAPYILAGDQETILRYAKLNETIEQLSKFGCTALLFSLVIFLFPPLIFTAINYYIFDLGEESFYLFFPFGYVFPLFN